jgi:Flp pilus assembly protein TadG
MLTTHSTHSTHSTHKKKRAARRGAAMVEAVVVISVFILFFLGMVYFRSMYQQKLRMMRLARAAAVGYALNGCNGSPTQNITQDLGNGSDNSSGTSQGGANVSGAPGANPSVGQNSGTPPIGAAV